MYWAIEKQSIIKERNSAATKEERDKLTDILNYMNNVEMAVIISEDADEVDKFQKQGLDITTHRNKMNSITAEGNDIEDRFKNPTDKLQLVFVCAMWLTGFDVSCLSTLYLDKPMKGHMLMQAIARAVLWHLIEQSVAAMALLKVCMTQEGCLFFEKESRNTPALRS